jgi:hypothetical protein
VNTYGACRAGRGVRGWWEAASDGDTLHSGLPGDIVTAGGAWRSLAQGHYILGGT